MVAKPVIVVATDSKGQVLNQILFGIEEEQVAFKVEPTVRENTIASAYQAAISSHFGVGIAFDEKHAILHFKGFPENEPLFIVSVDDNESLMNLGINAARLVKGIPFKNLKKGGDL
ncbi:glycerol dehydratase reactivase beta/small subunit family protein [Periweissella cryptocerci]|nr:glycerol dehydratase reactivase beta/small subunit family protein [Periweissella cryptocerci]